VGATTTTLPFYGYCIGQPALASTTSQELKDEIKLVSHCIHITMSLQCKVYFGACNVASFPR